jgi:ligand-binding sensor domain-containing protein
MRCPSIVPTLSALSLIVPALAFSIQGCGAVAVPRTRLATQPAAQSAAPTARAAAPFKVVTELDKCMFRIFQDSKGNYWFSNNFGKGSGLYRWNGKSKSLDLFTTESGLPDHGIGQIQEDRSGNLYFGTYTGICKFDGRTFTMLKVDDSQPAVTEVKLSPDILWFTAGGEKPHAVFYDGKSLRKLRIPTTPEGDANYVEVPRDKYPNARYSPYDAYIIYNDSRGNVWFGTATLGACRFDGKTFAWIGGKELGFDEKDYEGFGTRSIIEDRDGKFWITVTKHRFDMYPPAAGSATTSTGGLSYIKSPGLAHAEAGVDADTYIMSMTKDQAGDLWMATYGAGVWKYDGKVLTHYPVMVDGNPITVFSIYCDREGGLWLGTHEHGVCKFNGKAFEKVKF